MQEYKNEFVGGWRGEVGVCGPGSEEKYAAPSRLELEKLCSRYRSVNGANNYPEIVELGCGDALWIKEFLDNKKRDFLHYTGYDIHRRETWSDFESKNPQVAFLERNFLDESFKIPNCGIIIARNLFIHLSNEAILYTLIKCFQSGSHFLFTSEDKRGNSNYERHKETFSIRGLGLDLTKPPFGLIPVEGFKSAYFLL